MTTALWGSPLLGLTHGCTWTSWQVTTDGVKTQCSNHSVSAELTFWFLPFQRIASPWQSLGKVDFLGNYHRAWLLKFCLYALFARTYGHQPLTAPTVDRTEPNTERILNSTPRRRLDPYWTQTLVKNRTQHRRDSECCLAYELECRVTPFCIMCLKKNHFLKFQAEEWVLDLVRSTRHWQRGIRVNWLAFKVRLFRRLLSSDTLI